MKPLPAVKTPLVIGSDAEGLRSATNRRPVNHNKKAAAIASQLTAPRPKNSRRLTQPGSLVTVATPFTEKTFNASILSVIIVITRVVNAGEQNERQAN
jgi:hypothetical protein